MSNTIKCERPCCDVDSNTISIQNQPEAPTAADIIETNLVPNSPTSSTGSSVFVDINTVNDQSTDLLLANLLTKSKKLTEYSFISKSHYDTTIHVMYKRDPNNTSQFICTFPGCDRQRPLARDQNARDHVNSHFNFHFV